MSRWQPDRSAPRGALPSVVGIGAQAIAWWPVAATSSAALAPEIRWHGGDPAAALTGVTSAVPAATRLVLSHAWARHWLQAPVSGAGSLKELQAIAAGRCAQLFGGRAHGWRVAGDWQLGQPFLCAALPDAWADALNLLPSGSARLETSLQAMLSRAAATLPDDGWVVLREEGQAALLHLSEGRLDGLRVIHLPHLPQDATSTSATGETPLRSTDTASSAVESSTLIADECARWALREGWEPPAEIVDVSPQPLSASVAAASRASAMPRWTPWVDTASTASTASGARPVAIDIQAIDPAARDAVLALWAASPRPEGSA